MSLLIVTHPQREGRQQVLLEKGFLSHSSPSFLWFIPGPFPGGTPRVQFLYIHPKKAEAETSCVTLNY